MLSCEFIVKPSEITKKVIMRRVPSVERDDLDKANWGSLLLIQGQVAELIGALDEAVKTASVVAVEIQGNCPQHIQTVALIGKVADCKTALSRLKEGGRIK